MKHRVLSSGEKLASLEMESVSVLFELWKLVRMAAGTLLRRSLPNELAMIHRNRRGSWPPCPAGLAVQVAD